MSDVGFFGSDNKKKYIDTSYNIAKWGANKNNTKYLKTKNIVTLINIFGK